ncbi:uncharacterized protein TM35_000641110, partial [Trypanosoma theileri]
MMMMMCRVMCVLAVVLCCACGYTMTAAAAEGAPKPQDIEGLYSPWDGEPINEVITCVGKSSDPADKKCSEWLKDRKDWKPKPSVVDKEERSSGSPRSDSSEPRPQNLSGASHGTESDGLHVTQTTEDNLEHSAADGQRENGKGESGSSSLAEGTDHHQENSGSAITRQINGPESGPRTTTEQGPTQTSNTAPQQNRSSLSNKGDNSAHGDNNTPQQPSPAPVNATAAPHSQENTSTTPTSTESTTSEAPTTPTSPAPNAEITN